MADDNVTVDNVTMGLQRKGDIRIMKTLRCMIMKGRTNIGICVGLDNRYGRGCGSTT